MFLIFFVCACNTNDDASEQNSGYQSSNSNNTSGENSQENENGEDEPNIETLWHTSDHSDTYVLDNRGNNNTCAQCHSPLNFMPSMDDISESCLTCKFEIGDPEPFISENEWMSIPCKSCHKLDKKDNVLPEIFWLVIPQIDEYEEVSSTEELCKKCHISTIKFDGHAGTELGGAHADYMCEICHDPHSNVASCGETECHDLSEPVIVVDGHDAAHENVSCQACHDAGDFEVKPNDEGIWTTYFSKTNSVDDLYPTTSHNIVLEVSCERCHFSDNPWGLSITEN